MGRASNGRLEDLGGFGAIWVSPSSAPQGIRTCQMIGIGRPKAGGYSALPKRREWHVILAGDILRR